MTQVSMNVNALQMIDKLRDNDKRTIGKGEETSSKDRFDGVKN